jgi:putative component of toxin-antitoxin plasmid stabilization module
MNHQIIHYLDSAGRDVYQTWLDDLRDRSSKVAIIRRVERLQLGIFW